VTAAAGVGEDGLAVDGRRAALVARLGRRGGVLGVGLVLRDHLRPDEQHDREEHHQRPGEHLED